MLSWSSSSFNKQRWWLWVPAYAGTTRGEKCVSYAEEKLLFLLRLFRHALEAILHLLHLLAQIVDVGFVRRRFRHPLRLDGAHAAARRHERLEHREGLLKQFHVAADMFLERRERRA